MLPLASKAVTATVKVSPAVVLPGRTLKAKWVVAGALKVTFRLPLLLSVAAIVVGEPKVLRVAKAAVAATKCSIVWQRCR